VREEEKRRAQELDQEVQEEELGVHLLARPRQQRQLDADCGREEAEVAEGEGLELVGGGRAAPALLLLSALARGEHR